MIETIMKVFDVPVAFHSHKSYNDISVSKPLFIPSCI